MTQFASTSNVRKVPQPRRPHAAGSGRGSHGNRRPVCISPYPPHRSGKGAKAHCTRSNVTRPEHCNHYLFVCSCAVHHFLARDTRPGVTTARLGAGRDEQFAVTEEAAITAVSSIDTVTSPYNAMDLGRPIAEANHRRDRSLVNSVCEDCGGTICSKCNKCHFCEDVDLPCAGALRHRIYQGEARRIHSKISQLLETLNMRRDRVTTAQPGVVCDARPAITTAGPGQVCDLAISSLTLAGGMYVFEQDQETLQDWPNLMSEEPEAPLPLVTHSNRTALVLASRSQTGGVTWQ